MNNTDTINLVIELKLQINEKLLEYVLANDPMSPFYNSHLASTLIEEIAVLKNKIKKNEK